MVAQEQFQAAGRYCGVGRRFLATLVDGIILGIIAYVIGMVFGGSQAGGGSVSVSLAGPSAGITMLIYFLYFVLLEAFMGATIGKMILGMKVVKADGSRMGLGAAIVRNLLRIIDALPFAYILGAILVWTSSQKQRLGDRVAKTVVVRR